ncbi:hypothetical protein [Flavobacterium sp. WV_118_3]|uniref:hypothetical protein n=1 Tax=Flavobacterium sp. WV_118_3 TaxID=3151764 RepID=UPI002CABFC3A|nr:hypothetical protein [Flavobacterium sp.]
MKNSIVLLLMIGLFSCQPKKDTDTPENNISEASKATIDYTVATQFISDYVHFLDHSTDPKATLSWIQNNKLLTSSFKDRYSHIMEEAWKEDPELGLGFDPVFDGQDYPDNNYTITAIDSLSGFVTVSSESWKEFAVVMRVVQNGKLSLVDGSGIINIPEDKRAQR